MCRGMGVWVEGMGWGCVYVEAMGGVYGCVWCRDGWVFVYRYLWIMVGMCGDVCVGDGFCRG